MPRTTGSRSDDGGWRFTHRSVEIRLTGDLSAHSVSGRMTAAPSDADEIRDLLFAYCWHMDRGEFDALGALFAHASMGDGIDARTRPSSPASDAIAALYRDRCILYPDGTPRTKHVCTNAIDRDRVDDGRHATSRSYFLVEQQLDDFPLQPIVGGRYHDRFERVDGRLAVRRAAVLRRPRRRREPPPARGAPRSGVNPSTR